MYGNVNKKKGEISENVFIFVFIVRGQYVQLCGSSTCASVFSAFSSPLPWHIDVSIVRFFTLVHTY